MDEPLRPQAFIVRITGTRAEGYAGIVERVRTGEKHRFQGLETLGGLIGRLVTEPQDPHTTHQSGERTT
jgi:hypothetical protein